MLNLIKKFVREEEGLEMVEWALVAALLTSAAAAAFTTLGGNVTTELTALAARFTG